MIVNRKTVARLAGVSAATAVALGFFSAGAANADTFIPLPGGHLVKTLSDGTVVDLAITGESANINASMGSTPLHRNVWVSGTAVANLSSNTTAKGGNIYPGYVVGCQVNIAGGGATGNATGTASLPDSKGVSTLGGNANVGGNLSLGPGQATSFFIVDREQADDFGNDIHRNRNTFTGNHTSVSWADETIGLNGCAGYAQARSFFNLEVETDTVITWTTLWGQPFSLG